jgi:tetratricopeptide (TPR) repeat protein
MRTLILASALATLTACGPKAGGTYEVAAATGDAAAATSIKTEADGLWAERGDKAKLEAALAKYEQAYASNPTDRDVVVKLTRGYYFLGDAHESDKDAKMAQWDKSIAWGKKCMALNKDFTALLDKGDEDEASATRATTKDDVPCMYWMATSLGKWAKANGIAKSLKHLPTVKAFIGKVSELDPAYFHAASDRYWGAYYSVVPSSAGQDLDKSKAHFDKSIAAAPNYFGTKVLMAENLAVKKQDAAMFDKLLDEVIAGDPNVVPEIAPENTVEQAKAKALKAKKSDFFR